MKECKYCGSTYADSLSACPNCGGSKIVTAEEKTAEAKLYVKEVQNQERSVSVPAETEKKRFPGFVIALGVVVAVIAIIIAISAGGGAGAFGGGNNPGNQTPQVDVAFEAGQKYYNTGNYEAAIGELSDVSVDSEHYEDAQTMLADAVEKFRTATLDRSNTYTNNGEYETALSLLVEAQAILPEDVAIQTAYDNTYAAYIDAVIAKADSYSQTQDYETAVGVLNTAKTKFPYDTRLEASYVATYASYKKQVCENAIIEADAYAADGYYVMALRTLNAATDKIGQEEKLSAKLKVYEDLYVNTIVTDAKAQYVAYNAKCIFAAIDILKDALENLPNNEKLIAELAFYEEHAPVRILTIVPSDVGSTWGVFSSLDKAIDNKGNIYTDVVYVESFAFDATDDNKEWHWYCYKTIDLDYQYSKITGVLFQNEKYAKADTKTVFQVQGYKGEEAQYYANAITIWEGKVTGGSDPISFSVDVSGRKYVLLQFLGDQKAGKEAEAYHYAYLAELYLWK